MYHSRLMLQLLLCHKTAVTSWAVCPPGGEKHSPCCWRPSSCHLVTLSLTSRGVSITGPFHPRLHNCNSGATDNDSSAAQSWMRQTGHCCLALQWGALRFINVVSSAFFFPSQIVENFQLNCPHDQIDPGDLERELLLRPQVLIMSVEFLASTEVICHGHLEILPIKQIPLWKGEVKFDFSRLGTQSSTAVYPLQAGDLWCALTSARCTTYD